MSEVEVVRAWKDRRYRRIAQGALPTAVPAHPAGAVELDDERLATAYAACLGVGDDWCSMTGQCGTLGCCLETRDCTNGMVCAVPIAV